MGEEGIRTRLTGSAAVAAIVGDRVFAGRAPQNATAPFIVWQRVSGLQEHALDGATDIVAGRFQVDCYAASYEAARRLGRLCARALQQNDGALEAFLEGVRDVADDDLPVWFRRSMDFMTMERIEDGG